MTSPSRVGRCIFLNTFSAQRDLDLDLDSDVAKSMTDITQLWRGASLAFKAKIPIELIKIQGDWASDAYLAYLAIPLEQRIQVASRLSKAWGEGGFAWVRVWGADIACPPLTGVCFFSTGFPDGKPSHCDRLHRQGLANSLSLDHTHT